MLSLVVLLGSKKKQKVSTVSYGMNGRDVKKVNLFETCTLCVLTCANKKCVQYIQLIFSILLAG